MDGWVAVAISAGVQLVALAWAAGRVSARLEAVEGKLAERRDHEVRISLVEQGLSDLRELVP